ncbi:hypothetical protein CAPTEDRAFT_200016 [Capitella teleta]|uniref:LRRNT domain-containing protein n=1 Tax=Capitella teleta TaxID=283909 RepID=R7T6G9_CAPTE|nr:hypothetical protein CAPTEDRAFT_200016 [Capitella teleta]|eukprot:ELT89075.1 hypothetical protein CAPTEDRAFT_200016 [Capitella teleta]
MAIPYCFLALMLLFSEAQATECPSECHCNGSHVSCRTSDVNTTLPGVPPMTTHLLLLLDDHPRHDYEPLLFTHLAHLEVVLLDRTQEYGTSNGVIFKDSFAYPSKIRVFKSKIRLQVETDVFSRLHSLEHLTLSGTSLPWSFVPLLMAGSLCHLENLTSLDLTHFSLQYGLSPQQTSFNPIEVFGRCNASNVRVLNLSDNDIYCIVPTLHLVFRNLKVLDLSRNQLPKCSVPYPKVVFTRASMYFFLEMYSFDMSYQGEESMPHVPYTFRDLFWEPEEIELAIECDVKENKRILADALLGRGPGSVSNLSFEQVVLTQFRKNYKRHVIH